MCRILDAISMLSYLVLSELAIDHLGIPYGSFACIYCFGILAAGSWNA